MHISTGIFQRIIKITKYHTFSKVAVQPPQPSTCKPLITLKITILEKLLYSQLLQGVSEDPCPYPHDMQCAKGANYTATLSTPKEQPDFPFRG